jgi:hypothetical protein
MACGRPAYVHDYTGSDGWVTAETYDRLEANGFAGFGVRRTPDIGQLQRDFLLYDPALGRAGQDLVRTYHDARLVTAGLVALVERLRPPSHRHDPAALSALRNLADSQLRADLLADEYRLECGRQAEAHRREDAERQQLRTENGALRCELARLASSHGEILASSSWRITRPLRWIGERFPAVRKLWRRLFERAR